MKATETWAFKSNIEKLVRLWIVGSLSGLAVDSVSRISSVPDRFISVCFLIAFYLSANAFDDLRLKRAWPYPYSSQRRE